MPVVINGTTGVSGTDGTVSSPAVQGTDTNTGIFFPAADTIAFAEGGTEVMRLDANGNLGIGTTQPLVKLQVGTGSAASTNYAWFPGNVGTGSPPTMSFGLMIGSNYSAGSSETNLIWGQGIGSAQYFAIGKTTGSAYTEQLRIDATGRVFSPNQPRFFVNRSDTTAYNGTVVLFNNVELNVGSCYNASTGRFTAPVAGYYFFHATGGNANSFYFDIRKNAGNLIRAEHQTGAAFHWLTCCRTVYLATNDYVDVYASAGNTRYDSPYAGFGGYLLG